MSYTRRCWRERERETINIKPKIIYDLKEIHWNMSE
jgi:hypothetical protein